MPAERRLVIQGFFKRLLIGRDGEVEDAEPQVIFAGPLLRNETGELSDRNITVLPVPMQQERRCWRRQEPMGSL